MKRKVNHKKSLIWNTIGLTLWSGIGIGNMILFWWIVNLLMEVPPDKFHNRLLFIGLTFVMLIFWMMFNIVPEIISGIAKRLKEDYNSLKEVKNVQSKKKNKA